MKFRLVADAYFEAKDWDEALLKLQEHFITHNCLYVSGQEQGYEMLEYQGYMRLDSGRESMPIYPRSKRDDQPTA